ncbi:hypothetical protein WA026_017745 [Henosepilachna vigintioctopunctata]|uniref:Cilia- and flagella-associated protein 299 n=1 Tax=Henosepilachna vigintioctopunctata TaxID=420089 RepID=A0AAW1U8D7_9CUCU
MVETNPQIEADRRLLKFDAYEDYLDSMVTGLDKCLLPNRLIARKIAELGYRTCGETLSREQFERRRAAVINYLHPTYKPYSMASTGLLLADPAQRELALRERPNRIGILTTIVFLRHSNSMGSEISGYIDYADQLKKRDWNHFFKRQMLILPKPTDLGYYHWKTNQTRTNDSENYKVLTTTEKGLQFQNRFDRKIIIVDPCSEPGQNTTRKRVPSQMYTHMILFDHIVRQRI